MEQAPNQRNLEELLLSLGRAGMEVNIVATPSGIYYWEVRLDGHADMDDFREGVENGQE